MGKLSMTRLPLVLLGLMLALGIALGIAPHNRGDWLLENALAAAGIVILVLSRRVFPLSNLSYALLFVFLVAEVVKGAIEIRGFRRGF